MQVYPCFIHAGGHWENWLEMRHLSFPNKTKRISWDPIQSRATSTLWMQVQVSPCCHFYPNRLASAEKTDLKWETCPVSRELSPSISLWHEPEFDEYMFGGFANGDVVPFYQAYQARKAYSFVSVFKEFHPPKTSKLKIQFGLTRNDKKIKWQFHDRIEWSTKNTKNMPHYILMSAWHLDDLRLFD